MQTNTATTGKNGAIRTQVDCGCSNLAAAAFLGIGCDIRIRQHDCPLELEAGPQCPVVEVAAWLTLFDKLSRIENSVVSLNP